MSTVVSETITTMEKVKSEEKSMPKLVRTSSIEKIKELNNYICSQNYYVVPALINWIKSSQSQQNTLETIITIYRYMLYNAIVYRVFKINQICKDCVIFSKNVVIPALIEKFSDSTFLLKIGVYSAISLVSLEFFVCIYLVFLTHVPIGLIFLICCVGSTSFLFYESIKMDSFFAKKQK